MPLFLNYTAPISGYSPGGKPAGGSAARLAANGYQDMNHIDRIIALSANSTNLTIPSIVNAYCSCLNSSDSAHLLKRSIVEGLGTRNAALRKVCKDMESTFLKSHERLIDFLISEFDTIDPRKRQGLSYCLHVLGDSSPDKIRHRVQGFFINSKYIAVRRRAYKSLMKEDVIPDKLVIAAWQNYTDYDCAWLIVNKFPIEYLVRYRAELSAAIEAPWRLAKLYLKIGAAHPKLLVELKNQDQISYAYVMAKLGKKIPLKVAIKLIDNNLADDRFGLLIWSLGQLKMRKALEYIEEQIPRIDQLKLNRLLNKSASSNRVHRVAPESGA